MLVASTAPESPAARAKGTVKPSDMPITMSRTIAVPVKCLWPVGYIGHDFMTSGDSVVGLGDFVRLIETVRDVGWRFRKWCYFYRWRFWLCLAGGLALCGWNKYQVNQATEQDVLQADVELASQESRRTELTCDEQVAVARINTLLHREADYPVPPPAKVAIASRTCM